MLPAPTPRLAAPALEHALRPERGEVAQVRVGDQQDVAAAADAHAGARPEPCAALADEDHPGLHVLAGEDLHAQHLGIRVAPAARGAEALLVRHYSAFFFVVVVLRAAGFFAAAVVEAAAF